MVDSVPMKQIVVGTRGSVIGQIGIRARTVLEKMFSRRVHLVSTLGEEEEQLVAGQDEDHGVRALLVTEPSLMNTPSTRPDMS